MSPLPNAVIGGGGEGALGAFGIDAALSFTLSLGWCEPVFPKIADSKNGHRRASRPDYLITSSRLLNDLGGVMTGQKITGGRGRLHQGQ